jgi:hypothetical protein
MVKFGGAPAQSWRKYNAWSTPALAKKLETA